MNRKRSLILPAVLLLASCFALAGSLPKTEVTGKVVDPTTNQPVAGAQVTYTNLSSGEQYKAVTDKHGKYLLKKVVVGRYKVEAVAPNGSQLFSVEKQVQEASTAPPTWPETPQHNPSPR